MIYIVNKHNHVPTSKDYYIGRGSKLGNPYTHLPLEKSKAKYKVATREQAIEYYRMNLINDILDEVDDTIKALEDACNLLVVNRDLNLVCYCAPKKCHGEVIKEFISEIMVIRESDCGESDFKTLLTMAAARIMRRHNISITSCRTMTL